MKSSARSSSSPVALPSLAEIEAERGRRSLGCFHRQAWGVLEPATAYVHNWHIDAIVVTRREIQNLVINVPPGFMKSLLVSVFWPAWMWTHTPETRFLTTSYIQTLAIRDCVKARRLMDSLWYQARWGRAFRFTTDQNEKSRYENDRTGYRVATSVHSATGERAHIVVTDDPHNIKEGESAVKREAVLMSWDEVLTQRLADRETGAKVIIMQRIHERDLTAHALKHGGYEHLCLPMEYEGTPCVTVLGRQDPREKEGALLWESRFPRAQVEQMKVELGIYGTPAQLQQRPAPRGGGLFQRGWFEIVGAAPREGIRGRYWDKAGTKPKEATRFRAKYTAGVLGALAHGIFYIEHVHRGQWEAADREDEIKAITMMDAQKYGATDVWIWVEQEPGSGGKESVESTIRNLAGYMVEADRPTGDKLTRAGPLAQAAKAGNVKLVEGPWNDAFLDELELARPGAEFLDQVDAAAGAFNKLALGEYGPVEEVVYDPEEAGGFVL
jgi:predicted phage terminase large subunit-like protein